MEENMWRQSVETWLSASDAQVVRSSTDVAGLRTAEQFVLCNMRLWWNAEASAGACARALIRNGFTAANLPATAHASFERFMMILSSSCQSRPVIHETKRRALSLDEARLLRAVTLCQEGYSCNAAMVLKHWLPATAVRVGLRNLTAFAILMALEGLVLPLRAMAAPLENEATLSRATMH